MKYLARAGMALAGCLYLAALCAPLVAPVSYEVQNRDALNEPPGRLFLLGTDDLGRDRFSRLLYGARTSLLLAPAAAAISTLIAAGVGTLAGFAGGRVERAINYAVDLLMGVPAIFLLLTLRSLLPLNTPPGASVLATFTLLSLCGWASGVRTISSAAGRLAGSWFTMQAKAFGCSTSRLILRQLFPNLMPHIAATFWLSVPAFVLAEANLSMLGLGVSEPLPSLGNLMSELLNYAAVLEQPWIAAPAVLLFVILALLQLPVMNKERLS